MAKAQSVIQLDPIDRKKKLGFFGRLLITRRYRGKPAIKAEPFGHYLFTGPQGSSKTASFLWYAEWLGRKYTKKRKRLRILNHDDCVDFHDNCVLIKFDEPPKVKLYSNFGVGRPILKHDIFRTIDNFDPYANEVRIVLLDEIHTYFPKDGADKDTKIIQQGLISIFSQLRKRNTFILSTAQVYGRLDKSLREQCLYMISCKVNINGKLVNDFIPGDDVMCDDLGRWAGNPKFIMVHGLPTINYDTKKVIKD